MLQECGPSEERQRCMLWNNGLQLQTTDLLLGCAAQPEWRGQFVLWNRRIQQQTPDMLRSGSKTNHIQLQSLLWNCGIQQEWASVLSRRSALPRLTPTYVWCCGPPPFRPYDYKLQMCCNETLQNLTIDQPEDSCCGSRAYNHNLRMCCDNVLVVKGSNRRLLRYEGLRTVQGLHVLQEGAATFWRKQCLLWHACLRQSDLHVLQWPVSRQTWRELLNLSPWKPWLCAGTRLIWSK